MRESVDTCKTTDVRPVTNLDAHIFDNNANT